VSTYWRRRVVALVIGLSVLAIVTWGLSGAMGGSTPAPSKASLKSVHGRLPSTGTHSLGTHSSGTHGAGRPAQGSTSAPPQHSAAPATPRPCPAADVVLSVSSSQASYTVRETPEFQVNVVSVDSQTCTLDIGARHLWLQISTGPVRVWSSAQCAEGEASMVTDLRRGVPTSLPIGWNGQISGPGCPGPSTRAASGTYVAVASDGQVRSNALQFRLG
jgi:hypothetical protein